MQNKNFMGKGKTAIVVLSFILFFVMPLEKDRVVNIFFSSSASTFFPPISSDW